MIIEIQKWDKYNPRKDLKSTSWFRLENTFWTDPAFFDFSNDEKMVWVSILCQASQKMKGSIEISPSQIAALLCIAEKVVITAVDKLSKMSLISTTSRMEHVHVTPPTRGRTTTNERTNVTNERTDGKRESLTPPPPSGQWLVSEWNSRCTNLSACRIPVSAARLKKIQARLKTDPNRDDWIEGVSKISMSNFCNGDNDRGWRADFEFLLKPGNLTKILEGRYDNRGAVSKQDKRSQKNADLFNKINNGEML